MKRSKEAELLIPGIQESFKKYLGELIDDPIEVVIRSKGARFDAVVTCSRNVDQLKCTVTGLDVFDMENMETHFDRMASYFIDQHSQWVESTDDKLIVVTNMEELEG